MKQNSNNIAITGATVIPVTGDSPIENALVLVENGRIKSVGPATEYNIPEKYEVLDFSDKWITPGLIDTNVHLLLTTIPEFFVKYEDRLTEVAEQSAQVALKFGLTTIADTWGPLPILLDVRDRINCGDIPGSRVLVGGNIVGTGGPFTTAFMGSWDLHGLTLRHGGWVHPEIQSRINSLWEDIVGPEMLAMTAGEAADRLTEYMAKGVDLVKIAVSAHGISPYEPLNFSAEVLRAMRDAAHHAEVQFQTHTFTIESLRLAVELEPDMLQHPNVMSTPWSEASAPQKSAIRGLIKTIADKNMYCGLMAIPERSQMKIMADWDAKQHLDNPSLNLIMAKRQLWSAGSSFEERAESVLPWLEAGVPFTISTDQGPEAADLGPLVWGRLGRAHFGRMEGFQDIGLETADILKAATVNGANAIGLGKEVGTIEAGKIADLLVLNADPLTDIGNLRKIHVVIKDGILVDRENLPHQTVLDYDPEADWPY